LFLSDIAKKTITGYARTPGEQIGVKTGTSVFEWVDAKEDCGL